MLILSHYPTFGKKLRYYRKRYGLSQKYVAAQLGIQPLTLRYLEDGSLQCSLSAEILQRLAQMLLVEPGDLTDP